MRASPSSQRFLILLIAVIAIGVIGLAGSHNAFAAKLDQPIGPVSDSPDLGPSYKIASENMLRPGERFTYTIKLINAGFMTTTARVIDPVPDELDYVLDSATGGGAYDSTSRTLIWAAIDVPLHGHVDLAFAVTATTSISMPTHVTNTATISTANQLLDRSATVTLMPPPSQSSLYPSYKIASEHVLLSGEAVTYTIKLINVGAISATANVSDPVPTAMNYVPGSATGGGVYDPETRTLTWSNVTVPANDHVALSFVTTATVVTSPTFVINTATIASGNVTFQRSAPVVIVPPNWPTYHPTIVATLRPPHFPTAWPTIRVTLRPTHFPTAWPTPNLTHWSTYVATLAPPPHPTATPRSNATPGATPIIFPTSIPPVWPTIGFPRAPRP